MAIKNIYKRNNTYYFRVTIHPNLRKYFQVKKFYVRSLETKNINIAKHLRNILYNKFMIIKDDSSILLEQNDIQKIVDDFKNIELQKYHKEVSYFDSEQFNEFIHHIQNAYKQKNYKLVKKPIERFYQAYSINTSTPMEFINVNNIDKLQKILMQTLLDSFNAVHGHNLIKVTDMSQSINQTKITPLKELIDTFLQPYLVKQQTGALTKNYVNTYINYLELFQNYFKDIDISTFKATDRDRFYNDVMLTQTKKRKGQIFQVSKTTLKQYIQCYRTFFDFLVANDYLHKNVWQNYKPFGQIKKKDIVIRLPYEDNDIAVILNFIQTKIRSKYKKELLTIIYFGMYTGMRESEIIELRNCDINLDKNYIDINEEERRIKNEPSLRLVPICDKLKEIILNNIDLRKTKPFTITPSYFSKQYSIWNSKCGFGLSNDAKTEKVFHSFRHTVTNKLKQKKIPMEYISEIVGHSHSSNKEVNEMTAGRYSKQYDPKILKEYVDMLEYDLTLDHTS